MSDVVDEASRTRALSRAIAAHGAAVFWNMRTDLPAAQLAPVVIHVLRARGGVSGMRESARLARRLAARERAGCR